MSSLNCPVVSLYFPISLSLNSTSFSSCFRPRHFLHPPCSCTYFPHYLHPKYRSFFKARFLNGCLICTPIYHRTLLHIPSTPLCRLCTPIYPRTLLHIPSTPICRLCFLMYPRAFLPTPSTPLYRPYTLIYSSLLIIPLMNLQDNGLGSSLVKSRSKRSYHHSHSKKLSIKDLALELAKKHVSSIILKT